MDDLHGRTALNGLNNSLIAEESTVSNDRPEFHSSFHSPIVKSVNYKANKNTPIQTCYSESSDYDFPSYQINQSVNKRTSSKSENEANDITLPISPVLSPIILHSHRFRPPSIHSLDTIAKRTGFRCDVKPITNPQSEKSKSERKRNIYENLQMTDLDISWVSSMASPVPPPPNSEFNTIEKATFFPTEKFQKIQPRALFSPTSDDNCGCSLLPMSSDSENEGEAYQTKMRLSDVCATLLQLEFKSQESDLNVSEKENEHSENHHFESCNEKEVKEEDDIYAAVTRSPVFVVKPKKSKSKNIILRLPEPELSPQLSQTIALKAEEETSDSALSSGNSISDQCATNLSAKCDDSFLDISFTQIDNMCKSLLNPPEKCENANDYRQVDNVTPNTTQKDNKSTLLKNVGLSKRHFYPSECCTDVECTGNYFTSYDEIYDFESDEILTEKVHSIIEGRSHSKNENISPERKSNSKKERETVEVLDEEEKMLQAVEEAEKTLAEEAQLARAVDEMENTIVPDLSTSTSRFPDNATPSLEISSAERSSICKPSIPGIPNFLHDETLERKFGFSTASGVKVNVSEEAMEKAKRLIQECGEQQEEENLPGFWNSFQMSTFEDSKRKFEASSKFHTISDRHEPKPEGRQLAENHDSSYSSSSRLKMIASRNAQSRVKELTGKRCDADESVWKQCDNSFGSPPVRTSTPLPLPGVSLGVSNDGGNDHNGSREFEENSGKTIDSSLEDMRNESVEEVPGRRRLEFSGISENLAFTTAAGEKVAISEEALNSAREFLSRCDTNANADDFISFAPDSFKMSTPKETFRHSKGSRHDTRKRFESCRSLGKIEEEEEERSTSERESETPVKTRNHFEAEPSTAFESEAFDGRETSFNGETFTEGRKDYGFSTASGLRVSVSRKALLKVKKLMADCEGDFVGNGKTEEYSFAPGSVRTSTPKPDFQEASIKRRLKGEEKSAYGEHIKRKDGGAFGEVSLQSPRKKNNFKSMTKIEENSFCFSTASGLKVSVSEDSLRKAKQLMAECDASTTSVSHQSEVKSEGNFETSDSMSFQFGFTTCLGRKVGVSDESLQKARNLMSSCDDNRDIDSELSVKCRKTETVSRGIKRTLEGKSKSELNESNMGFEPENSSNFDHRFITLDETGEGSIPAEEWDKSFTPETVNDSREILKKRKIIAEKGIESDAIFTSERTEEKEPLPSRKGTKSKRSLDEEPVPNKRQKHSEPEDSFLLTKERIRAREKLEAIIKGKGNVKPLMGSHLRKKTTMKQMALLDVVSLPVDGNCPGPSEASSFRFRVEDLCESVDGVESRIKVELEDGFEVIPDDRNELGVEEFKLGFLAGPAVQPNLVPPYWVENHYKWIVWKLAEYERVFPVEFKGKALTPRNVMLQLKYRYDREIDRHERSALKKILEKDDTPAKRIVLRVCDIKKVSFKETTGHELELTDGWYRCPAKVDTAMSKHIESGKVKVGVKLMSQGAVLMNCDQGIPPLEITKDVHLRIFTNSTRRVGREAKLGFQKNPGPITVNLDSISVDGGPISRVDVTVVRVYPILYSEKTSSGHRVVRNRRSEEKAEAEHRKTLEQRMERIYSQVRGEIRCKEDGKTEGSLSPGIEPFPRNSPEFAVSPSTRRDRLNMEISAKVEEKLRKENLIKRNVTELLKVKIVDARKPNFSEPTILSLWGPGEDVVSLFVEGKSIALMNLTVSNFARGKQINTTRQTRFKALNRICKYPKRQLVPLGSNWRQEDAPFGEVDLVGIVASVNTTTNTSQTIYLADSEFNFAGLLFWGGAKEYGWENVLIRGRVIACSNLCWKSGTKRGDVPVLRAREISSFTENPRTEHLKTGVEKLKGNLPKDINGFLSECEEKLSLKLENGGNQTEAACNERDINAPSNGAAIEEDQPETDSFVAVETVTPGIVQTSTRQQGKITHKTGGKSFRWLPYKNV